MTLHDKLVCVLIVEYCVLCGAAVYSGQHVKAVYWLGAVIISVGVAMQR
jgi:hypothetical protein